MISEDAKKNIKKTYLIILLVTILIALLVYSICMPFNSGYISIIISIISSISISFLLYVFSQKIILSISKAKKTTKDESSKINTILENICTKSNISIPNLYITDEEQPNIFTIGKNLKNSTICITRGLLENLDTSELEAVIAHEVFHIKNYDTFLSTITTIMIGMPIILSDVYSRHILKKHSEKEKKDGTFTILISLLLTILSPISAKIMELLLPKNRDYIADINAIKIIGTKNGLINALEKIYSNESPLQFTNISTSHMYIVNPIKSDTGEEIKKLLITHPSIESRIKNINNTTI